jgi:hypothetical protein
MSGIFGGVEGVRRGDERKEVREVQSRDVAGSLRKKKRNKMGAKVEDRERKGKKVTRLGNSVGLVGEKQQSVIG